MSADEQDAATTDDEDHSADKVNALLPLPALLVAAQGGQAELIPHLVGVGGHNGDLKAVSWRDRNAMHMAARCGSLPTVRALRAAGMAATCHDRDIFGNTALHLAARAGHLGVVRLLAECHGCMVRATNRFGDTPLHSAVRHDETAVAVFLIESTTCEPCARNGAGDRPLLMAGPLETEMGRGFVDALRRRAASRGLGTLTRATVEAALAGRADVVSELIKDREALPQTCIRGGAKSLMRAAIVGANPPAVVRVLVAHSACTGPCQVSAGLWSLPLVQAAMLDTAVNAHGAEVISVLVGAGADVDAYLPHTQTALAAAAEAGNIIVINKLLGFKASVNLIGGPHGRTALHAAAAALQGGAVRALLDAGADAALRDGRGCTARELVDQRLREHDPPLTGEKLKSERTRAGVIFRMLDWVAARRPVTDDVFWGYGAYAPNQTGSGTGEGNGGGGPQEDAPAYPPAGSRVVGRRPRSPAPGGKRGRKRARGGSAAGGSQSPGKEAAAAAAAAAAVPTAPRRSPRQGSGKRPRRGGAARAAAGGGGHA